MYGIFTYIWLICMVNVRYQSHGLVWDLSNLLSPCPPSQLEPFLSSSAEKKDAFDLVERGEVTDEVLKD